MPEAGRVVTGSAKGVRLTAPGPGTRPLSDRVKQALFGMLEAEAVIDPDGAFLDLYAGSGAAGIEALSRGMGRAVFVERDARAAAVIEDNLRRTHLAGGRVVRRDVGQFLSGDSAAVGAPFSAALVDPPYAEEVLAATLGQLGDARRGWLRAGAVVAAKHFWRDAPPSELGALRRYRDRRFGETMLSLYRLDNATPPPTTEE